MILLNTNNFLNRTIQFIDGALTGANTPSQSEPGSNDNEKALHIPQSSKTAFLPSDTI